MMSDGNATQLAGGELRLPKAKLDLFLSQDQATKREAKEWGKSAASTVVRRLLTFFNCPLRAVENLDSWPKYTARAGTYQTATARAQAGGASVLLQIDVNPEGPETQVWLEARLDPAVTWKGWVEQNAGLVESVVAKYDRVESRAHNRTGRNGELRPVGSAKFLTFRRYLAEPAGDGSDLIISDATLGEFAADFDDIMDGIMRETLVVRQRRYRSLRGIVPSESINDEALDATDQPILERASVVRALLTALHTRPLVLLAGVSGTGKTQLAKRIGLARALGILDDTEGSEGSEIDRQFAALVPEVVEPIGDGEWVWVRMPSADSGEETTGQDPDAEPEDDDVAADDAVLDEDGGGADGPDDGAPETMGESEPAFRVEQRFALVPVQSDWKEAASLWGWYHPIGDAAFHGSPALRVFLDAWQRIPAEQRAPHTVVLDEMNLSRLEHYGSDLLSAMENPGRAMISLHRLGQHVPLAGGPVVVPPEIGWRDGVRVIGTVNVDETTFSFAPKVLDRAAVLEFVDVDLQRFFVATGKQAEWDVLGTWFDAVQAATRPHNLHLGYRAAREVVAALKADLGGDVASWQPERLMPLLDSQLRNKVLPRVRGPRGSAEPALIALMALAIAGPEQADQKRGELIELARSGWPPDESEALQRELRAGSAAEKAWQMLVRLRDVGFTGFF